jgi:plastocyanin
MIGAVTTVAAVLLVGCGDSDPGGSSADGTDEATLEAIDLMNEGDVSAETGESEVTVDAVDNNFKPKYIEVSKGTAVKFVNEGRNIHNVLPVAEGAFTSIDADDFDPDDEGVITFDEVGDFPYYCSLHGTKTKGMIGGIRVVE